MSFFSLEKKTITKQTTIHQYIFKKKHLMRIHVYKEIAIVDLSKIQYRNDDSYHI